MREFQSLKQDHTQSVFHTFMSVFTLATRYLALIFASSSLRDHTYCKLCTPLRSTAVPGLSVAMLSRAQKARVCRTYPTGMMHCLNKLGVGYRMNGPRPYIYISRNFPSWQSRLSNTSRSVPALVRHQKSRERDHAEPEPRSVYSVYKERTRTQHMDGQ